MPNRLPTEYNYDFFYFSFNILYTLILLLFLQTIIIFLYENGKTETQSARHKDCLAPLNNNNRILNYG